MVKQSIRLGTRTSPLAMKQAQLVSDALKQVHSDLEVVIVPIKSAADWKKQDGEKALNAQAGGKGQFATEIENAHLRGEIDCGVHSTKDMPCILPDGLTIKHYMPRANVRDAFISQKASKIEDLPQGAVIGTCSPRRQSIALEKRPDLKIVPFRGNIQTRLDKIRNDQVDASFLAMAGIERLEIQDDMIHSLSLDDMLPAAGQGAICLETKTDDHDIHRLLDAISCTHTYLSVSAEREVLRFLDGSCHTPIGAYASIENNTMSLKGFVGSLDGQHQVYKQIEGECTSIEQALKIASDLAVELQADLPEGFLS
ncbi:MAG: hydroxymethylbilane synthase [Pseudomonadota bacterium]